MRKLILGLPLVAAAAALSGQAMADQITLGNNTSGSFLFTGVGGSHVNVSTSGVVGTNQAFFDGEVGTYTFGSTNFDAGPDIGGSFYGTGTESLSINFAAGDEVISGLVTWTQIKDHSLVPDAIGTFHISSLTLDGDADDATYASNFAVGSNVNIDLTFITPAFLSTLGNRDSITGTISTVEIVGSDAPPPPTVPEPASLALLGSALFGFGVIRRRKV